MDLNPYGVAIACGDGLVARVGDVVMYVGDATGAAVLLSALDSVAAAPSPGWALASVLASAALGPDSGLIPPFGVVAPAGDGLLLMLRGHVAAVIDADGASRTLAGDRALTWVDETLRDPVDKMVVGGGDVCGLTASPHTDLRAGVVPGGGFVVHRLAAVRSAPSASPASVAQQIAPETRAAPHEVGDPARRVERQPAATPTRIVAAHPAPRQSAPGRHFGTPPPRPVAPTAVPRPVAGVLAADDDEAVYPLDRPYVIGRNPMVDESVRDARASPIFLPDDPQVSRVHAYVALEAGVVLVRDASTSAGTFIAAPGDATWIRISDQHTELKPGWCLRIGQRILVYRKANSAQ